MSYRRDSLINAYGCIRSLISHSGSYGPTSLASPSVSIVSLPLFDPLLGTLTKVTLQLDASASEGIIAFDNEADIPTAISLGIGAKLTATAPSSLAVTAIPLHFTPIQYIGEDSDGTPDFVANGPISDAFTLSGGIGTDSDSAILTLPGEINPYVGLGTFDVSLESELATLFNISSGFGPLQTTPGVTSGSITVIYEYEAVPEASSLIMVSIVGLWGARGAYRRQRTRS